MKHLVWILALFVITACAGTPRAQAAEPSTIDTSSGKNSKKEITRQKLILQQSHIFTESPPDVSAKSKKKAATLANQALDFFNQGDYKNAIKLYMRSISLNAAVDQVYYEYGITLYKLNQFEKAKKHLAVMEGTRVNQIELSYYQGLVLYRLSENEAALEKFKSVRDTKDEVLAPLASMYAGIIETHLEKLDDAKASFEFILDNSKDPALDKKAEQNLKAVLRLEQFMALAKQKWSYSFYTGAAYDGNVLNFANNNSASDVEAYRLMYGGSVAYKALYTKSHSLIPQLSVSDIYSVDSDFKSSSTVQATDPLFIDLNSPYRYFFSQWANTSLSLTPGYQNLMMSLDEGNRKQIFESIYLNSMLTTTHADNLITDYKIEVSNDTSHIQTAAVADDQSAMRYTGAISNTKLFNEDGTKTLTFDVVYTYNDAKGDNNIYNRLLASVGGSRPLNDKWLSFARLDWYQMDFSKSNTQREDDGLVLTLGANYQIQSKGTLGFTVQYYDNNSSVVQYDFDKFYVSTVYSFNSGFF